MKNKLIERIENLVEANPWHGRGGKFSSAKKLAKDGEGSYSGRKKYRVKSGSKGPSIKRINDPCGRDARPGSRKRCSDGDTPKWARDRYSDKDKEGK